MRFTAFALLLLGLFTPAAARADDVPPAATRDRPYADTVLLRGGGLYRGHVTEIVPGDHVTIMVEGGETKHVAWSKVDRVVVGSGGALAAPASAPAPATQSTAEMKGPRARVRIVSPTPVVLYRRPAGTQSWVAACTSPCDEDLPIGDSYLVRGNGVHPSREVHLGASESETVTLAIDPSSPSGMVFGILIATAGGITAYAGLGLALGNDSDDDSRSGGLVALAVGAAMLVGGILIYRSARTTDVAVGAPAARASGRRPFDAYLRSPSWRKDGRSLDRAPQATFPVLFEHVF